jgi:hypothetical protein
VEPGPTTTSPHRVASGAIQADRSRLPRGEGEAVPVNRIEPWIVPHEPDLDLLADAQRFDALPLGYPTAPGRTQTTAETVRKCPARPSVTVICRSNRRAPGSLTASLAGALILVRYLTPLCRHLVVRAEWRLNNLLSLASCSAEPAGPGGMVPGTQ